MKLFLAVIIGSISCLILSKPAEAYTSPGKPTGYINDFAGVISPSAKQQLEADLAALAASSGAQIAVVTVRSIGNDTVEKFAVQLFEEWGIGQKGKDNGVLFLVALEEKKVRIEVGYGLEEVLTDAEASRIIRQRIVPEFQAGRYEQGIISGTQALIQTVSGQAPAGSPANPTKNPEGDSGIILGLLFLGFFLLQTLTNLVARTKSWWLGGVMGAIIGLIVTVVSGFLMAGLVALVVLIPLGLLFDFLVSRNYRNTGQRQNPPWWFGGPGMGGGGWGGGRSGGFGGFGGGRSGGGGASGGW